VAGLLDVTVASVNSALQRARATLASTSPTPADPYRPMDRAQEQLLRRYVEAFEQHEVDTLVSLLHEDATTSMPPFVWWLHGRAAIRQVMAAGDGCRGDRLLPTMANGTAAFGQYRCRDGDVRYEPFALVVLEFSGNCVVETTTYLDAARLFPLVDLPMDWQPQR
jgi:RNA polymerase sigma-70 factor (ECF subfamily)